MREGGRDGGREGSKREGVSEFENSSLCVHDYQLFNIHTYISVQNHNYYTTARAAYSVVQEREIEVCSADDG